MSNLFNSKMHCRSLSQLVKLSLHLKFIVSNTKICAIVLNWRKKKSRVNEARSRERSKPPTTRRWSQGRNICGRKVCSWPNALLLKRLSDTWKNRKSSHRRKARKARKALTSTKKTLEGGLIVRQKSLRTCRKLLLMITNARMTRKIRN